MARVFFSYSHKDEALRDQLEGHLAMLKNQRHIEVWHDRRIIAGSELDESISTEMELADIILLLVSSDFLASYYCYSKEMAKAMERHELQQARVIPIILRACDWSSAPFGKLMAAPKDGRPVNSWPDKDEAFADVARQVRGAVEALEGETRQTKEAAKKSAAATAEFVTSSALPRSSNVRITKNFSEKDRDDFLRETYEFITKFFEGSMLALRDRNQDVTSTFERVDSRRMSAIVYRNGMAVSECSIRIEGMGSRGSIGIAYSDDASMRNGSYNEMLHVETARQTLYLKAIGIAWQGGNREQQLSAEGAAELLWSLFIARLQI